MAPAVIALTGVLLLGVRAAAADTHSVSMVNSTFSPAQLTVQAGDTVTWSNDEGNLHTVTADDGSFDSGLLGTGGTFSRTFVDAGTIAYYCALHGGPGGGGMSGQVTVLPAATTTATTTPTPSTQPTGTTTGGGTPTPTVESGADDAPDPAAGDELARTGRASAAQAAAGLLLLLFGAGALAGAARARQAAGRGT